MMSTVNSNIDKDDIDFEAFISTAGGLQAFLEHLGKENEINYLVVECMLFMLSSDAVYVICCYALNHCP